MASAPQTITPFFLDQSRFQNLDDFIREQDEIQAQLQAELTAQSKAPSVCASPAHKKTKILPDIDALKAERDALEETGDTNWVGRLLEYHQGNKLSQPSYTDHNVGHQKFSSSLKIAENPEPFTTTVMFSRKKDAKQYIAKLAVDWLVAQNSMPSDGSVKFPKSPQVPASVATPAVPNNQSSSRTPPFSSPSPATPAPLLPRSQPLSPSPPPSVTSPPPPPPPRKSSSATSPQTPRKSASPPHPFPSPSPSTPTPCSTQVPILCTRLGFTCPTYTILQTSLGTSIYHGWADFGVDARIDGKVGEFRDVYGKKNAKEVCARMVLSFLRDIERLRLEGVEEMEMKRKRIGGGSEGSSSSESF